MHTTVLHLVRFLHIGTLDKQEDFNMVFTNATNDRYSTRSIHSYPAAVQRLFESYLYIRFIQWVEKGVK